MKPLPYVISFRAITDIEEIWLYTVEKRSVDQANRYYNLIFEEINYICKVPDCGKQVDYIRIGYRVSKVKSHLIFYKVVNDMVEIIRVLHQRMDVENQLKD